MCRCVSDELSEVIKNTASELGGLRGSDVRFLLGCALLHEAHMALN